MRIAITNEKGGVGKTTTAVNLAACLGARGRRVLLVDIDAQANCTSHAGIEVRRDDESLLRALAGDVPLASLVVPDVFAGVSLVPSSPMLAGAPTLLAAKRTGSDRVLRRALGELPNEYDYTIIDCPPTLGVLTVNALVAATHVIVPVEPAAFSLDGLAEVLATIDEVRDELNPDISLLGVLVCRAETNTRIYRTVLDTLSEAVAGKLFATVVPRNVKLQEAAGAGVPVVSFDPSCAGTEAYQRLAEEVDHARAS